MSVLLMVKVSGYSPELHSHVYYSSVTTTPDIKHQEVAQHFFRLYSSNWEVI